MNTTLENLLNDFTAERLLKDFENLQIAKDDQYLNVYQDFVQYFANLKEISEHNAKIGISFTYSWMPTILKKLDLSKLKSATEVLNRAKEGKNLSSKDLDVLKSCFNNSLVGSSKLLHFINPEKFAIWDSRVYRYLFNQEPYAKVNNNDNYLTYLDFCEQLTQRNEMRKLQEIVTKKVGYPITKMRALELVFFYNGEK